MKRPQLIALGLAVGLLAVVEIVAYRSTEMLVEATQRAEHARVVQAKLDSLLGAVVDAQTARRGFALTGDELFLAPFWPARRRADDSLADLRRLLAGNAEQSRRLEGLEPRVHSALNVLEEAVETQRSVGGTDAMSTAAMNEPVQVVREAVREMDHAEERLLLQAQARTDQRVMQARATELGGTAIAIFLVGFIVLGLRREVQRRRESEEASLKVARELSVANSFLDSIFENLPNMVFVKDAAELKFVRLNKAGEKLLGVKREALLGKSDRDFFPPEQVEEFIEKDRETLRGGDVVDIPEEPIDTKSGTRWLHTRKVPVLGEGGEPEFLLGISEDITDQRAAEAALREAKDAAESAIGELEAFSYSVAHDLRAPLRGIDGFSQALLEDYEANLDDQGKDYLRRVRAAAGRMGDLIDDLLSLSHMSRVDIVREEVALTELARRVGEEQRAARGTSAELVVEDGLTVEADPRLLRVLLENLLGNAMKFSARRERPRVEVGRAKGGAFFVRDNGAGFDSAGASKLFTAFQRYHRPTEFEGTGVGLATVQRVVVRHGGRVWAESKPGQGATFYFTLSAEDESP